MIRNKYFDLPGVSNSVLSWILPESGGSAEMYQYFMANPPKIGNNSKVDIGTALHKFIEVPDKFKIQLCSVPGPGVKNVIDLLLPQSEITDLENPVTALLIDEAIKVTGYGGDWKAETKLKKIITEGNEYFKEVRKVDDVTALLDATDAKTVETGMQVLKDKAIAIFSPEIHYPIGVEIFKELVIEFEIERVKCKALLDRLIVDHTEKWFQVEDLKTTATFLPLYFGYSYKTPYGMITSESEMLKWQVHRQMAFYSLAALYLLPGYEVRLPIIHGLETVAPYRYQPHTIESQHIEQGTQRVGVAISEIKRLGLDQFSI